MALNDDHMEQSEYSEASATEPLHPRRASQVGLDSTKPVHNFKLMLASYISENNLIGPMSCDHAAMHYVVHWPQSHRWNK